MANTIHVRGEGGGIFKMSLPLHEAIADRLAKGYLVRVNPDGSTYTGDNPEHAPDLPTERPKVNDPKAKWVAWAVHEGAKPDDADAATKQDLIEKYGI